MYRALLCFLAVFITIATPTLHGTWTRHHSWGHPHHNWGHPHHNWALPRHNWRYKPNVFQDFTDEVIRFDWRVQTFCNSQYVIEENYVTDGYELVGTFQEFSGEDFTIEIKHRVVNIIAEKGDLEYNTLIIVPKVANTKEATWTFSNKELRIAFPYTYVQQKSCDAVIDESIITVSRVNPPVTAGFDYRVNIN